MGKGHKGLGSFLLRRMSHLLFIINSRARVGGEWGDSPEAWGESPRHLGGEKTTVGGEWGETWNA